MGRKSLICIFLAFLLITVNAAAQAPSPAPKIDIILINQTPYPVQPGDVVTIEIEIQNNGYGASENLIVEINLSSPFILLPGEQQTKNFGIIGPSDSVKTSYNIQVDSEAISNNYKIKIYSRQIGSIVSQLDEVSIKVQGEPKLIIENVTLDPEKLNPGDVAELGLKIKNVGTGKANNVEIEFPNNTYLKPLLSMGEIFAGDIEPGESKNIKMQISIASSAGEETYTPALTIRYKDESNTLKTETKTIGIPVSGSVQLEVIKKEALFNRNILRIEVANKGTAEAKAVEAKLIMDGKMLDIDYISQIKENKKTTFDFPLVLKGSGQLVLNYMGPGIEKNQVTKDIVLDFKAPQTADGTAMGTGAIVIIVIIIFLWWRKKKKKA